MTVKRRFRLRRRLGLLAAFLTATAPPALADDYGAARSGNWNDPAVWTPGGIPSAGDRAFIGGSYPAASAQSATVRLTQDESVGSLFLGYDNNGQGTLDLGDHLLTIGGGFSIGYSPGTTGTINRGTGSFSTPNLQIDHGNSLTLGAGDQVGVLGIAGNSRLTTAATGNILYGANIQGGS